MKKLLSFVLALVTLMMFAVPVLAEEPYETIPYVYSSSGGSEHFSFYSMCQDPLENAWVAGDGCQFFKLFAKNRSGLRIKDIELRYVKGDFAHAAISCGKKVDPGKTYQHGDWLRINDIHSDVFVMDDSGSWDIRSVAFDEIRVYYEDAEEIAEDREVIYYNFNRRAPSENFVLINGYAGFLDWNMGNGVKICSENENYQIKRLEIVMGNDKRSDNVIAVSNGTVREAGAKVKKGNILHIDDIHSSSVSFTSLDSYCNGTDVIVYYEASGIGSTVSEGNGMIVVAVGVVVIAAAAVIIVNKRKKAKASS